MFRGCRHPFFAPFHQIYSSEEKMFLELAQKRRSIRKYTDKQVEAEKIDSIKIHHITGGENTGYTGFQQERIPILKTFRLAPGM